MLGKNRLQTTEFALLWAKLSFSYVQFRWLRDRNTKTRGAFSGANASRTRKQGQPCVAAEWETCAVEQCSREQPAADNRVEQTIAALEGSSYT